MNKFVVADGKVVRVLDENNQVTNAAWSSVLQLMGKPIIQSIYKYHNLIFFFNF